MKKNRRIVLAAGLFILSFAVCANAWFIRQQKSESTQEPVSKAAPEMQRLSFYLGDWDYTETFPKSAAFPDGATNTGVYTSKLGPGGNSLINSFHSKGPAGEFEGLLVITWDPRENAYKSYVFGNGFPGALVETGQFEGDALVFRTELAAGSATVKLRNTTRVLSSGKLVSEQYSARSGAPEKLFVSVEAKKR